VVHLLDEFQEFEIFTRRRPPTLSTTFNNESAPCGIRCRELSMISAITSRGHLRFVILEDGSVNADAFIEFIKRLLVGVKRKIFLIVDGGPAHRAKKTKAFVESLQGKLRLFFLPPYSPNRSPDDLVWKRVKADTVGRMMITSKGELVKKVRSSLLPLQRLPSKVRSFFQKETLRYAA
jgi:hypothetical protein